LPKTSAGILLYRRSGARVEVLLVHPGGPFWARKDAGAWSIPKGEHGPDEDPLEVAWRELAEEVAFERSPPDSLRREQALPLGEVKQRGGKVVRAWAVEGDLDAGAARSNTFEMEWPPRSGQLRRFPEVDRAGWFQLAEARGGLNPAQHVFLDRLQERLSASSG
jgi:predicted NUDIX family NTP pyrophosphohydrolase